MQLMSRHGVQINGIFTFNTLFPHITTDNTQAYTHLCRPRPASPPHSHAGGCPAQTPSSSSCGEPQEPMEVRCLAQGHFELTLWMPPLPPPFFKVQEGTLPALFSLSGDLHHWPSAHKPALCWCLEAILAAVNPSAERSHNTATMQTLSRLHFFIYTEPLIQMKMDVTEPNMHVHDGAQACDF